MAVIKKINHTNAHRELIRVVCNYVFAPENMANTNSIPKFLAVMTLERSKLQGIDALFAERSAIITGFARQKRDARAALAPVSFSIMSAVKDYALDNNLQPLAADMKVTLAFLERMSYIKLRDKITESIGIVTPLLPQLAGYNITDDTIENWQLKLDALVAAITGPQNAINQRKNLGNQIQVALRDAMDTLKNKCDATAAGFLSINFPFYNGYLAQRKLKITGIHHTRADVSVFNEISTPLFNINVTVNQLVKDGKTYRAVSGTTDLNGFVSVKEFENGYRTITISGEGIQTKTTQPFKFELGKAVVVSITAQETFNIPAAKPQAAKNKIS